MNMAGNESYRITPESIVANKILFRIPLYQRLFTWGERQVRQLMEDLQCHFEKRVEKPYYLGMITVIRQGERLDLIDGQQRTTALMLLAIGLMRRLPDGEIKQNWNRLFGSSNRVFFNGRSNDREYLLSLSEGKLSTYRNVRMDEGLLCIDEYLNKHFDEHGLVQFATAIFKNLTLFVTELPKHYAENPSSLNEYFEAMNSAGKSLEQHEILKVELLRNYDNSNKLTLTRLWNAVCNFEQPLIALDDAEDARKRQCEAYKRIIQQCKSGNFSTIDHDFSQQIPSDVKKMTIAEIEVKKHDFSNKSYQDKEVGILKIEEFLLLVLALYTGKDELAGVDSTKLHDTFKKHPIPQEKITDFYNELYMYRLMLDMYVVRLKYGSSSSSHTLIFKENDADEEKAHARLRQFQAMLAVSTEPHIWLVPLLRHLKSLDHEPTQMELLKFLMVQDMLRPGHNECPHINNLGYDARPRYWFWRLDYALWEKLMLEGKDAFSYDKINTEAIRQYEFRRNRSIEHLHPRNEEHNEAWPTNDIHSFGNLAMISNGFNTEQKHWPVRVKFANITVQIDNKNLQSIKLYFMYLKAKNNPAEWSVATKNEHADEMLAILNESLEKVKEYEQQ